MIHRPSILSRLFVAATCLSCLVEVALLGTARGQDQQGVAKADTTEASQAERENASEYTSAVKPLLAKHCAGCHGVQKQQSGLRIDTASGMLTGGDSGPAVVAGMSAKSLLIHAVTGTEGASKMPPEGPGLSAAEIEVLKKWIDAGARGPANEIAEPSKVAASRHWSFQPVVRSVSPVTKWAARERGSLDSFVAAKWEPMRISPSAEATRTTLIRRVTLDLLGVVPTPEQVREFLADSSPDAYERLVDRLLASPHFGERWGRDWLDVARYADSNGFTRDMPRTIWKYRDWVVNALNRNQAFDEFVIDQLAGDMLPEARLDQIVATGFHRNTLINEEGGTDPEQFRNEAVVDRVNTTGTVFLGLTIGCAQCHDHKYDPISQREYYQLFAFFNSTAFTGGDPAAPRRDVPTEDEIARGEVERQKKIRAEIARVEKEIKDKAEAIATDLSEWEKTLTDEDKKKLPFNVKNAVDLPPRDRSATHKRDLDAYFRGLPLAREKYPQLDEIARLRDSEPKFPSTMVMQELATPRETHIHLRGDFLRKGAKVSATIPAVLGGLDRPAASGNVGQGATAGSDHVASTGGQSISNGSRISRLDLARWLVSDANPLTSRVTVNRVWQKYFGRGLVETENDFGTQGTPPSHPELLDWLASEFAQSDVGRDAKGTSKPPVAWDLKRLHRLLVTSATYRQSSHHRADLEELDPTNKWLARQNRFRLDAEVIRDAALAAGGLLTTELGGPPVYPPQPDGVFDFTQDKKPWKTATGRDRFRKAMYTQLWRSSLYPALTVFDFPDANVACTRRVRSNTPLQSLTLANDQTFVEFARGLANRLLSESDPQVNEGSDDSQRLTRACQLCLSREPSSSELARLKKYLDGQRSHFASDDKIASAFAANPAGVVPSEAAAWTAVARVLLNLDEFITRE